MKQLLFALLLAAASHLPVLAQEDTSTTRLLKEGMALHDERKYNEAIAKYDAVIKYDPKNVTAYYEKAYSLAAMGKNEQALEIAKKIMRDFSDYDDIANVYMIAGNALDDLKKTDEAIQIYDEGIKHFPDVNLFYYNKGLALARLGKKEEAWEYIKKDVLAKPAHASGQRFMGIFYENEQNLVPAIFAYGLFMLLEPNSNRSADNLSSLQKLIKGNATVDSTRKNSININLIMPSDAKKKDDDFSMQNMSLSLAGSLSLSKELDSLVKKTKLESFKSGMSMIIESSGNEKKKKGFAWKYYVPFYVEMNRKNFLDVFCNLCFLSSGDTKVASWLSDHKDSVDDFYTWFKAYDWPKKTD